MTIGILYPRSKAHIMLGPDFIDGLKTCLQHHKLKDDINYITENIGFGSDEKEIYIKAEKLLMENEADLLVAFIDLKAIALLEPLLFATGKLMLVVNAGANYPQQWNSESNIIYLTLQHAFMCWLTGQLVAESKSANAALATSFYDCGYLHVAAMSKSFSHAGGVTQYNYINKQPYNDSFEINELVDFLKKDKETRNLLCLFDSLPASLFYNRLQASSEFADLRLYVSPMMLEAQALEGIGNDRNFSIDGHTSWSSSGINNNDTTYSAAFIEKTNRKTSVFGLLGWETGLFLNEIMTHCKDNINNGTAIKKRFASIKLQSPRGELVFDENSNYFIAPACRVSISKNSATFQWQERPGIMNDWKNFTKEPASGIVSGWLNTYLCY